MNSERQTFLNLRSKPGRVTAEEAAWYLGFMPHEIPMLMAPGLIKPLGQPPENGCKYFALKELDDLKQNPDWLRKASDAVLQYWKDRNLKRPTRNAKARWPHKLPATNPVKVQGGLKPISIRKSNPPTKQ